MTDAVELETIKDEGKMSPPDDAAMLSPESKIRPQISIDSVSNLVERLYGITSLEVKELPGYDDRNFKIDEDPNIKNPLILNHSSHGYILKVMNSLDSLQLSFVEAQCELMNYLGHHAIKCPTPFRNVYGHLFSLEQYEGKSHVVRLLDFQPGEVLANAPKSEFLFYQVGEYVANLDRLLKDFSHSGLKNRSHIWMLDNLAELEKFKSSVKDADLVPVVDEVLKQFQETVVPKIPDLERGLIHGDFNEDNIIVNLNTTSGKEEDWRISAILDFGDISVSCYLFELAIAMTYMMRVTGDLATGGFVLAGYSINRIIPLEEYELLKITIAARLTQTLILSLHRLDQHPENEYIAKGMKSSAALLLRLWREDDEEVLKNWRSVADDYLTRSRK